MFILALAHTHMYLCEHTCANTETLLGICSALSNTDSQLMKVNCLSPLYPLTYINARGPQMLMKMHVIKAIRMDLKMFTFAPIVFWKCLS